MEEVETIQIALFVCCHKECVVPEHPLLVPIQTGAALVERRFPGFLRDDVGDHISDKNRSYCELTAQYWAWKNCPSDYVGFFHYRRYLYPDPSARRPYRICRVPSLRLLERLGYDRFESLIRSFDFILPKAENQRMPVREQYASAPFHRAEDLLMTERIIQERFPDFADAMERYLSGYEQYFGNIFIMRKDVFEDYCEWLFSILEEFDRLSERSRPSELRPLPERRVNGYIAERLLGVYYARNRTRLRSLELPRVHFFPRPTDCFFQKTTTLLLPPGTRRRAVVKRIWRKAAYAPATGAGQNETEPARKIRL